VISTGGATVVVALESVGPLFNADLGQDYSSTFAAGSLKFDV
jgi:hypothetical protein